MATACLPDDKLVCPICLGQFDRPRSLPCLHTFCTSCLCAHIETVSESMPFSTFHCPVCRAVTRPVRQFTNRNTWAEQFPVNYWILSVIEEQPISQPCVMCEIHTDMKVSLFCRDHACPYCPKCVALYHRQCEDVVEIETEIAYVDLHKEKNYIEHLNYELMNRVTEVQNASDNVNEKLEMKKTAISNKIQEKVESMVTKLQDDQSRLINELDLQLSDVSERINANKTLCSAGTSVYEEANQTLRDVDLDDKNQDTLSFIKLQSTKSRLVNFLRRKTKQINLEKEIIEDINFNISEQFRSMLENGHIGKVERAKRTVNIGPRENMRDGANRSQRNESNLQSGVPDDTSSSQTVTTDTSTVECNTVISAYEIHRHLKPYYIQHSTLSLKENICFKFVRVFNVSTIPSGLSWVTSAVFLHNDLMLVSDHKSKSVKLVKDGKCICELRDSLRPWGIAKVHDSQIAVSNPDQNCINIYDLNPDITSVKMKVLRKLNLTQPFEFSKNIDTEDACFGFCFTGNHFVVACEDVIKLFDVDGWRTQVLRGNFKRVVDVDYSIVTSSVLACDEIEHCVSALSMTFGRLQKTPSFVYSHQRLKGPQTVAVGQNGDFYVSGFVSKNIHIVSQRGETLHIIEIDQQPWAVCIDATRMLVFISFYPDYGSGGACSLYELKA